MNATLGLIFMVAIFVMGIGIGAAVGFTLYKSHPRQIFEDSCCGELIVAPGDEDAERYMFLDLDEEPASIEQKEFVVLYVKNVQAREKHPA